MRLITALKWTLPVWLIAMGAMGALMFLTDNVGEIGRTEALRRYALIVVVSLPLIAWIIKRTGDDIAWWRSLRAKEEAEYEP